LKLFGFEIKRKEDAVETQITSFAEPLNDDGALTVGTALGGSYGMLLDLEGSAKNEAELVTRYRTMTLSPEIQQAVDEVVNEAISVNTFEKVVEVVLDDVEVADRVKERIFEEFDNILKLLDFSNNAYEIFAKFYVDGRLNYHAVIDEKNLKKGIVELRYLDPRKIRLIREVEQTPIKGQGMVATTKRVRSEYYMYSDNGFGTAMGTSQSSNSSVAGLRIAKDSIIRVTSGLLNETNSVVFSYLHRAIKPLNQLRMLEDANVIYTLVRSPERRVFYIDVGNLPKAKAEQYLHDMMARHKNKVVYDPTSGEIRDDRKMMCYDLGTKIPLLDGRTLELRQIIEEHENGKTNWVYSCDPISGKFYPGPVSWAGITKHDSEVVKVTFDNGKSVICTPDHKFPVWNKGFVEAQYLTTEDSIIPGHRKQTSSIELIYKNDTKTWEYTDHEIGKWKDEQTSSVDLPHQVIASNLQQEPIVAQERRIVSVEKMDDRITVGSMSIDNEETYHSHHTYLLDAGVYTKNTMTEDYWFPRREGCFDLSTKVDLLDGRSVEIGQLIVEHKAGKENWTFSISPDGKVVPGKISWAGVTRNDTQVLDVYLDNGEIITATPDHKFILRTGEKIEAKDLVSGSSLMPFNKKMKGINQNAGAKDYLQVQNNDDESWVYSHRMVNEYFNGPTQKGNVIHHIDNHRFNNNPENLIEMGKTEHLKLHTSMAKYGWRDEVYDSHCENLSIAGKEFFKTDAGFKRRKEITDFNNQSEAVWNGLRKGREVIKMLRDEDKKILSKDEYLSKWSKGLTSEVGIQASKMAVEKIKRDRENLTAAEFKQKYSNRGGSRANYNNKVGDISLEQFASILKTVLSKNVNAKNKNIVNVFCEMTGKNISYSTLMYYVSSHGYETLSHFIYRYCGAQYTSKRRLGHVTKSKRSGNHTVVKVAYRDDLIDVGTLTIDGDHLYHDYHNFALSSGIFVMNSRTTEIETLPSAGTLGDNEQLSYFQNKLYRSLNVPVGRLQPENMYTFGRASEITREELRFSKFIKRLRIRFSIIFDKCLERQLVLKGIIAPDEWSDIQNSIRYDFMKDNFFEELKESEILREKLTTLREVDEHVGKYFSRSWVKKNVLFFTDDEVKDMDKEIAKEKADGLYDDGMDDDDDGMDGPEDDVSPPTKDDTDQEPDDEPEEQEAEESFINRGIVSKFSKGPIKK
jgi:hypothetical protein